MVYVFDSSSFRVLDHYFPQRFPSFWKRFNGSVQTTEIISAREVYKELKGQGIRPHLNDWIDLNKKIFLVPGPDETAFVGQIFAVRHFQQLVAERQRLKGIPVGDPFVIAMARARNGCVVTEESKKENAAPIPNVCEHFGVACCNLEVFMETKGWQF
jgi:hypothetical protein